MFKTIQLFLPFIIFSGFVLIACQKQDVTQQQPKTNSIVIARTDNKDYRIPEDTAIAWTTRFRKLNETTLGNKMPTAINLPINGIQQMLQLSIENKKELSGMRLYLSVNKDNQITALYVPVDKEGNDILYYGNEANFNGKDFAGEDGSGWCPPTCNAIPNVLNSSN